MQLENYRNVSKSQLIVLAKEKNAKDQDRLWFQIKTGAIDDSAEKMTVRDMRATRKGEKKDSELTPGEKAVKSLMSTQKLFAKLESINSSDVIAAKKGISAINKVLKEKALA